MLGSIRSARILRHASACMHYDRRLSPLPRPHPGRGACDHIWHALMGQPALQNGLFTSLRMSLSPIDTHYLTIWEAVCHMQPCVHCHRPRVLLGLVTFPACVGARCRSTTPATSPGSSRLGTQPGASSFPSASPIITQSACIGVISAVGAAPGLVLLDRP